MNRSPHPDYQRAIEDFGKLWHIVLSGGSFAHRWGKVPFNSQRGQNTILPPKKKLKTCSQHSKHLPLGEEDFQQMLDDRVVDQTTQFYRNVLLPQLMKHGENVTLVKNVHDEWHTCNNTVARYIVIYLNNLEKFYFREPSTPSFRLGLESTLRNCFETCVYQRLSDTIRQIGFSSINRFGEIIDESCLKHVVSLIASMGKNRSFFIDKEWDHPLGIIISKNMTSVVERWNQFSIPAFLTNVHRQTFAYRSMFISEQSKLLFLSRLHGILSPIRSKLFFGNCGADFARLLHGERYEDWQKIFCLYATDKQFISMVSRCLDSFVQQVFLTNLKTRLSSLTDYEVFQEVLAAWSKLDNILRNGYAVTEKDEFVVEAIRRPFRYLIYNPPRNIKLYRLAVQHCNNLLSRNGEAKQALSVSRIEELQQVLSLAGRLPDTDAFMSIYRTMLANRLLEGTYESEEMEQLTTQEVFKQFGQLRSEDICRFEAMIKDVSTWSQFEHQLAEWMRRTSKAINRQGFKAEAKIIRSSPWPDIPDARLKLPKELESVKDIYKEFFDSQHPSKKVLVHSCAGRVVVRTKLWHHLPSVPVRLSLTTGQMSVLSLFEKRDHMTVKEIVLELLSIKNEGCLNSLDDQGVLIVFAILKSMMGAFAMLRKFPVTAEFREGDVISLNKAFRPTASFVNVPLPDYCKHSYWV